jgi:hypothetical protein
MVHRSPQAGDNKLLKQRALALPFRYAIRSAKARANRRAGTLRTVHRLTPVPGFAPGAVPDLAVPNLPRTFLVAPARESTHHSTRRAGEGYVDSVARDRQAAAAANPALRHLRAPEDR